MVDEGSCDVKKAHALDEKSEVSDGFPPDEKSGEPSIVVEVRSAVGPQSEGVSYRALRFLLPSD